MFKNDSITVMIMKHRNMQQKTINPNLNRPHNLSKNDTCKFSHLISPGSVSVALIVKGYSLLSILIVYLYGKKPHICGRPQNP